MPLAPLLLQRHNALDPPSGVGLADFFRILPGEKASGIERNCGKPRLGTTFYPSRQAGFQRGKLALVKETCLTRPAPCVAVIFSLLKMSRSDVITLET